MLSFFSSGSKKKGKGDQDAVGAVPPDADGASSPSAGIGAATVAGASSSSSAAPAGAVPPDADADADADADGASSAKATGKRNSKARASSSRGGAAFGASSSSAVAEPVEDDMAKLVYNNGKEVQIHKREELTKDNLVKMDIVDKPLADIVVGILWSMGIATFQTLYDWAKSKSEETIAAEVGEGEYAGKKIGKGTAAKIITFVEAYKQGEEESRAAKRAKPEAAAGPKYVTPSDENGNELPFTSLFPWLLKHVKLARFVGVKFNFTNKAGQQDLLGPLNNPVYDWPIIHGSKLDMRLYRLGPDMEEQVKALSDKIVLDETQPRQSLQLIAVSGSSKTGTILKLADVHFVVYMQTVNVQWEGDQVRKSRPLDSAYQKLHSAVNGNVPLLGEKSQIAIDRIATEYLARVCLLVRIVQDELKEEEEKQVTVEELPSMFLAAQVNGSDFIESFLRRLGGNLTVDQCADCISEAVDWLSKATLGDKPVLQPGGDERRLVLALDEIEVPAKVSGFVLPDKHDPQQSTGAGTAAEQTATTSSSPKQKSMLSLLTVVACHELGTAARWTVVFAGTGSSHRRTTSLISNIGKGKEGLHVITQESFRSVTPKDVRGVLSRLQLPSGVDLAEEIPDDLASEQLPSHGEVLLGELASDGITPRSQGTVASQEEADSWAELRSYLKKYVLGGRMRLLARAIEVLKYVMTPEEKEKTELTKEEAGNILLRAFESSVSQHFIDLVNHISKVVESTSHPQERMLRSLASVYFQVRLTGGSAEFSEDEEAGFDLTALGVCGSIQNQEGQRVYKVTERFAMKAILEVCSSKKIATDMFRTRFDECLTTLGEMQKEYGTTIPFKGNVIEHILLKQLYYLSENQGCNCVADIPVVKEAVARGEGTEFWGNVPFTVKSPDIVLSGSASTAEFLSDDANTGMIFSPEPVCRPDGIVMLKHEDPETKESTKCAIFVASAVYSGAVPKEKMASQILSTDPALAYRKVDGEANKNARKSRAAWVSKKLDELKVIRIHLNLPNADDMPGVIDDTVMNSLENGVIVHVDQTNLYRFFPNNEEYFGKLRKLLAMFTNTEVEEWKTNPSEV